MAETVKSDADFLHELAMDIEELNNSRAGATGAVLREIADKLDPEPKPDPLAGRECPNCGDEMVEDQHTMALRCATDSTCGSWATRVELRAIRENGCYEACMAGCGHVGPVIGNDVCQCCGIVCSERPAIFDDWNHPDRVRKREQSGT